MLLSFFKRHHTKDKKEENAQNAYEGLFKSNAPIITDEYYDENVILFDHLRNPLEKNIGVIGPLGSGKSSLVLSFRNQMDSLASKNKNNHSSKNRKIKEKLTRFVSLTHLMPLTKPDDDKREAAIREKRNSIELELVRQLVSSAKWWEIPSSKIRSVVPKFKTKLFFFISLLLAVLAGCAISILSNPRISKRIGPSWPYWWIFAIALCVVFSLISLILLYFWKPFSSFSIETKNIKAECQTKDDGRNEFQVLFDELLYFFGRTKTTVVFFEDFDRLKDLDFFIELRNLNFSLNESKYIKERCHSIAFVYVVSDCEMWTENGKDNIDSEGANRAKFFDFIVTIIPIVDTFNGSEELYKGVCCAGIAKDIVPESFYYSFSEVLTEKRIVNNIINDVMFRFLKDKKKFASRRDAESLISLCIYKNLFPSNFEHFLEEPDLKPNDPPKQVLVKKIISDNKYLLQPAIHYWSYFENQILESENARTVFSYIKRSDKLPPNAYVVTDPNKLFEMLTPNDFIKESSIEPCFFGIISSSSYKKRTSNHARREVILQTINKYFLSHKDCHEFFCLIADYWVCLASDKEKTHFESDCSSVLITATSKKFLSVFQQEQNVTYLIDKAYPLFSRILCDQINWSFAFSGQCIMFSEFLKSFVSYCDSIHSLLRTVEPANIIPLIRKNDLHILNFDYYDESPLTLSIVESRSLVIDERLLAMIACFYNFKLNPKSLFTSVINVGSNNLYKFIEVYSASIVNYLIINGVSIDESTDGYSFLFDCEGNDPNLFELVHNAVPFYFSNKFKERDYPTLIRSGKLLPDINSMGFLIEKQPELTKEIFASFFGNLKGAKAYAYTGSNYEVEFLRRLLIEPLDPDSVRLSLATNYLGKVPLDDIEGLKISQFGIILAVNCGWVEKLPAAWIKEFQRYPRVFSLLAFSFFNQLIKKASSLSTDSLETLYEIAKETTKKDGEIRKIFADIAPFMINSLAMSDKYKNEIKEAKGLDADSLLFSRNFNDKSFPSKYMAIKALADKPSFMEFCLANQDDFVLLLFGTKKKTSIFLSDSIVRKAICFINSQPNSHYKIKVKKTRTGWDLFK